MTKHTSKSQANNSLFHQTKNVKSYLENFGKIDFGFVVCPHCGSSNIIRYGTYSRLKAGVLIQRFQCGECKHCFSWLPPFLLPRKHYTITEIEPGIEAYVAGSAGYIKTFQAEEELPCCQETLWRWIETFAAMAEKLHAIARATLAKFKSNFKFEKDKRLFCANFPPAQSKLKGQNLSLLYQLFILREYFASLVEPKDFLVWLVFQKRLAGQEKSLPTQFANDQKRLKRDNALQPP